MKEAVILVRELTAQSGETPDQAHREKIAEELIDKGLALVGRGLPAEAIAVFDEVISRYGQAPESALSKQVANALFGKSVAWGDLGQHQEESAAADELISRFSDDSRPAIRELVAGALLRRAAEFTALGRPDEAIKVSDDLIIYLDQAPGSQLRQLIVKAMVTKGLALAEAGHSKKANAVVAEAAARLSGIDEPELHELVAKAAAIIRKSATQSRSGGSGRPDETVEGHVALLPDHPMRPAREQHARKRQKPGSLKNALEEVFRADSVAAIRKVVSRHPELLEETAIPILAAMAEKADDERIKKAVNNISSLLMEWRALGLDAPMEDFTPLLERDLTDDIASIIDASDTAAGLRAVVAQCPGLLGEAAECRLLEMQTDSSAYSADRLYAIITFLRACRGGDIDAACAAYDHDVSEVEAASRLAAEYGLMTDKDQEVEFLRQHPVLVGRQAERSLTSLAEAIKEPETVATLRLPEKLDTIRRLREGQRAGR